jgi:hypothetical protein
LLIEGVLGLVVANCSEPLQQNGFNPWVSKWVKFGLGGEHSWFGLSWVENDIKWFELGLGC